MDYQFFWWAIILGGLSAVSLPIGSLLGLYWHPSNKITGALTAFGGGALIAALAVELVAPTAMDLVNAKGVIARNESSQYLVNMLIGAIIGGILFVTLDQIITFKGGFLRNAAAAISYFTNRKAKRRKQIIDHLGVSELIRQLPLDMVEEIVNNVNERNFAAGEQLFSEGDTGEAVFFIEAGKVAVSRGTENIANLESGDVLGEIAVVTGAKRTATATAKEDTLILALPKDDFDHLRRKSPKFDQAAQALAVSRLQELVKRNDVDEDAQKWTHQAITTFTDAAVVPTDAELKKASAEHGGAPIAIWLGMLLDGIPESFVIGSALVISITTAVDQYGAEPIIFTSMIPYTLIAGLFLANFPEAMSSSIGMQKQGWGRLKVFFMWFSLMVMTAIGSGVGYLLGGSVGHDVVVFIEGLAAGAMLTMIAAAMIPEALHLGGNSLTGLATLAGFLSAVAFKLIE